MSNPTLMSTIAYFFVDEDGTENVSNTNPFRHPKEGFWCTNPLSATVELPLGTIERLFGKKLTWDDEPLMIPTIKRTVLN